MTHRVDIVSNDEAITLPEPLALSARFTGLDAWLSFVHKMYRFPIYKIASRSNGKVDGWLTLTHIKHPIFGNYLTTSPFGSYGGFTYVSTEERDALLKKAEDLANELGIEHVNLRFE